MQKDFIKERTPYGLCYTFNSGINNTVKETNIPGNVHVFHFLFVYLNCDIHHIYCSSQDSVDSQWDMNKKMYAIM